MNGPLLRPTRDVTSTDNGPDEASSPRGFQRDKQDQGPAAGEDLPSGNAILLEIPRLAVELSRLEVVVLADILSGLSTPPGNTPARNQGTMPLPLEDEEKLARPSTTEVLVETQGATIVLHEAGAYAEDPGPHSFVLNLGNARLHFGGNTKPGQEEQSAPMVAVSSGDLSLHETLRASRDGRSQFPLGQLAGPVLFRPGQDGSSSHPLMEELPALGFVSGTRTARTCFVLPCVGNLMGPVECRHVPFPPPPHVSADSRALSD